MHSIAAWVTPQRPDAWANRVTFRTKQQKGRLKGAALGVSVARRGCGVPGLIRSPCRPCLAYRRHPALVVRLP